jgi:enoyl-CoA hydratase
MLFESRHLRITAEYGTATLWLGFPGELANTLDLARLRELDEALRAVAAVPSVRILAIRSANLNGFCAGIHPDVLAGLVNSADRAAFSWYGQQVFNRLAELDAVTIAVIDGPCLGAGLELALACDYRLCVARSTTHLGFPDRITCFGASARLRNLIGRRATNLLTSGEKLSGREAWKLKLVDLAYCERRARIELRSFLDRLELRPLKPRSPGDLAGLAAERRAFAAFRPQTTQCSPAISTLNPIPPFPETIGLLGDDLEAAHLASDAAMRGSSVVVCGNRALVFVGIDAAQARGFITPLEAEQTRRRVRSSETLADFRRAGLVFVARGHNLFRLATSVLPRVVVCVIRQEEGGPNERSFDNRSGNRICSEWENLEAFPYPRRVVQVSFRRGNRIAISPSLTVDSDGTATVTAWLKSLGREPFLVPVGRISPHNPYSRINVAVQSSLPSDESMSKSLSLAREV